MRTAYRLIALISIVVLIFRCSEKNRTESFNLSGIVPGISGDSVLFLLGRPDFAVGVNKVAGEGTITYNKFQLETLTGSLNIYLGNNKVRHCDFVLEDPGIKQKEVITKRLLTKYGPPDEEYNGKLSTKWTQKNLELLLISDQIIMVSLGNKNVQRVQ